MPTDNLFERATMDDTSVLEYDLRKQQIANYAAFAKLALLVYDIFINLDREVRLVWSTSDRFRWSNAIYFTNRYPVVAYQIWSICYTPKTPQASVFRTFRYRILISATRCIKLPHQSLSEYCLIIDSTASWILRVYAVVDHGLVFGLILSLLGLAIIALDILQGVQSTCTHNTLSSETLSGVLTYIFLAAFDILATFLVTIRMVQAIRRCGGFRHLDKQNLSEYVLRSGILYFGYDLFTKGSDDTSTDCSGTLLRMCSPFVHRFTAKLTLQLQAPQGLYSPILNNFLLILSSVMIARFLLGLREMNESRREYVPEDTTDLNQATTLSILTWDSPTNLNLHNSSPYWMNGSTQNANPMVARRIGNDHSRSSWWAGVTRLVADFDAEIEVR
ncbi:hypothetical protein F5050DRAFT_1713674 [Lentinula boryana]|uniref:DUF6533 domain-containing protein n=1 Tax=Lentinula boryana TaxID=40481 RepID=A0ABQ8Q7J4_9AGAR|nr:hypothetical protein F5050DRAFT_1713674 [Lentinula boryana]